MDLQIIVKGFYINLLIPRNVLSNVSVNMSSSRVIGIVTHLKDESSVSFWDSVTAAIGYHYNQGKFVFGLIKRNVCPLPLNIK